MMPVFGNACFSLRLHVVFDDFMFVTGLL